jgi:hypothetical protein
LRNVIFYDGPNRNSNDFRKEGWGSVGCPRLHLLLHESYIAS